MSNTGLIRLQKFIADCGVTSRRKAENLIIQGRVKVNGERVTTLGTKVNPNIDAIEVDDQVLRLEAVDKVYILLNKPRCYMTTVNDPEGRKTVMDLIPRLEQRVYPVGRLDYLSEGLILMTNDGEMANKVMHPSHEVMKVYEVKVFGAVTPKILAELKRGRMFEEGYVKPHSVRVVKQLPNKTWIEFRLKEGRNREIRRICEAVGMTVDKLRRVAIQGLSIDRVALGRFIFLTKAELEKALGMRDKEVRFVSSKKTIDLNKKGYQSSRRRADDKYYTKYRKDVYHTTLGLEKKRQEEIKAKELAEAAKQMENFNK